MADTKTKRCEYCAGYGSVEIAPSWEDDHTDVCPKCDGTGQVSDYIKHAGMAEVLGVSESDLENMTLREMANRASDLGLKMVTSGWDKPGTGGLTLGGVVNVD